MRAQAEGGARIEERRGGSMRRSGIMGERPAFSPTLEIVECDGHGRWFEAYENGAYLGTWDGPSGEGYRAAEDDWNGPTLAEAFGGRLALLYGYDAYEAECARRIEANPYDWDTSDVVPAPFLVMVRTETKGAEA